MGNNPISNFDVLGDIFRGVNETSANRALSLLRNTFGKIDGAADLMNLFSISNDGVTFNAINEDAFKIAISRLGADAQALAQGYFSLISSEDVNFIAVINSDNGETADLSQAKGMSETFKNISSTRLQGADGKKIDGGKTLVDFNGQSIVAIDITAKTVLKDVEDKKGNPVDHVPSGAELMAHETVGHALSLR